MMKDRIARILATCLSGMIIFGAVAQETPYTRQVITVNSGKYEFSPPYTDFVSLQQYNPVTQSGGPAATILTQSAQDIIVHGHYAYVAAEDSLIKYDIDTWSRVAAIADSGLARLCIYKDHLLVSKQYPVVAFFLEVLDTAGLGLVARVTGIPGDCGGITAMDDSVYVAVNGGWAGTEGKLAVIDPSAWNMVHCYNFGTEAAGIFNLFQYKGKIISVNKTPFGAPATGSIAAFSPPDGIFDIHSLPVTVGNAAGIMDSLLFLRMNNGLGSYDLSTFQIADTTVIPDPGSLQSLSILSAAVDSVARRLYVNLGDYSTAGFCLVTNLSGDSLTSYSTGISSECIAIDYRHHPSGIGDTDDTHALLAYPNPAGDRITLQAASRTAYNLVTLMNSRGQEVCRIQLRPDLQGNLTFPVDQLYPGIYFVKLESGNDLRIARFIKE